LRLEFIVKRLRRADGRYVRHIAVELAVQLKAGREARSALRTEELHAAGVLLEVQGEGGLYLQDRAVLEADHRAREILNVADVVRARGGGIIGLRRDNAGTVQKLLEGCAVDGNRLRVAHEITGQIDDVHAHIDQRTARGAG